MVVYHGTIHKNHNKSKPIRQKRNSHFIGDPIIPNDKGIHRVVLLMEEIQLTSWYGKYPIFQRVLYMVVQDFFHQQYLISSNPYRIHREKLLTKQPQLVATKPLDGIQAYIKVYFLGPPFFPPPPLPPKNKNGTHVFLVRHHRLHHCCLIMLCTFDCALTSFVCRWADACSWYSGMVGPHLTNRIPIGHLYNVYLNLN